MADAEVLAWSPLKINHLMLLSIEHLTCFAKLINIFFYFVTVTSESAILHKYTVTNGKSMFRIILEPTRNSILMPRQRSLNGF